jgi:hypothetical protein
MKKIIKKLPNNKSPGADEISNILIKNLTKKALVQATHITNAVMLLQYFPSQWKHSITIPILKPNKNPTDPASYRPISLLSLLSKLVEKAILAKLRLLGLELRIPDEQFGFREGHSTTLLIAKVAQDAITNFNAGKSTFLLTLDISRAFDSVWLNGLTHKLIYHHHLPPFAVTLLHSYLMHRTSQVRVEGTLSTTFRYHAGVPQGAVLSPILFNLYLADFPTEPNSKIALFADDALIYAHASSAPAAKNIIQYHVNTLIPWCDKWKITLNIPKCESLLLTKKRSPTQTHIPNPITINGEVIPILDKLKYLGVIIDKKLSKTHYSLQN